MKRYIFIVITILLFACDFSVSATQVRQENHSLPLSAESCYLIEASTGRVIYKNNEEEPKPPASVTKIMTLLLTFEALEEGKIKLNDPVTVSEHAASMGGSQVFLEPGEIQTVETMIKCIAVSSANDASVAMAEHISGSENAFVEKMNQKAKELQMNHTSFVNCCGLDAEGHVTSAKDIALMSRELTTKYPDIFHYTSIWMDEFTHKTKKGESVFGLSSTNKLLKSYIGCNGLKTGSTSKAKFCISATARRNNISLIAVVMGCPDSKSRMKDITTLFDYGFSKTAIYEDADPLDGMREVPVLNGERDTVKLAEITPFSTIIMEEEKEKEIEKTIHLVDELKAPLKENETIGEIEYKAGDVLLGVVPVKTGEAIKEMTFSFSLHKMLNKYLFFSR